MMSSGCGPIWVPLSSGYRFKPTDEELIANYLQRKLLNLQLQRNPILEIELYNYHPSELDKLRAKSDEKCYFFTSTEKKYPHGSRPTRSAKNGYWKSTTGKEKVHDGNNNVIGIKRTLVFHDKTGNNDKKTGWIMKEYKIDGLLQNNENTMKLDDWVLCSIYERPAKKQKQKQDCKDDMNRENSAPNSNQCENYFAIAINSFDNGEGRMMQWHPHYGLSISSGYRFDPTDQELIVDYLQRKLLNLPLQWNPIMEIELYMYHPSELDQFRPQSDQKCYFFTSTIRKHVNGSRPTRSAKNGYWKATSNEKVVDDKNNVIGIKRALVFYDKMMDKDDKKTDWIMHEYKIDGHQNHDHDTMKLDDFVLCSIYENCSTKKRKQNQCDNFSIEGREVAINPVDQGEQTYSLLQQIDQQPVPDALWDDELISCLENLSDFWADQQHVPNDDQQHVPPFELREYKI